MKKEILVKYFNEETTKIKKIEKGDWIDLRCIGAKSIIINNRIEEDDKLPKLIRETAKTKKIIEKGLFQDEDGVTKEVEFFRYKKGEFLMLDLGVAMQLPEGYEAHVLPRSSTFKNFTMLETNSQGIIDESYCGDEDRWFLPVLAMQDGFVIIDERVCQFRIMKKMEKPLITKVKILGNKNRGGHGSTGTK